MRRPIGLLISAALLSRTASAGVDTCPEGFGYSRYYAACIQTDPLPAHAHWVKHYSEQHPECDDGFAAKTRDVVDPDRPPRTIWQTMALLEACEPTGADTSWWGQRSTGAKVAIIAGGALFAIGGTMIAGAALGWWTLGASAATAGAEAVVAAYANSVATVWLEEAGTAAARTALVRLMKMMRSLGFKLAGAEGKATLLSVINAALVRAGSAPWTMTALDVALDGIDWLW
jgi:hypothetical protein